MVNRPDVVLFMTDQQRHDQLGYRSDGFFETPALDGLAAAGVRFDECYTTGATCIPARVGLLTGVFPRRLVAESGMIGLPEGTWTVAHAFRAAGYETALIGKMHFTPVHARHGFDHMRTSEHLGATRLGLRPDGTPDLDDYHAWLVDRGLARWSRLEVGAAPEIEPAPPPPGVGNAPFPYELALHPTTWVLREVQAFLAARSGDRPLFLIISFPHPHTPLNPLGPYAQRYDAADVPVPAAGDTANDALPAVFRDAIESDGASYRPWRVRERGEDALRARQTRIRALVRQIDDAVAELLPRFPLDRTVVAFTSDHGDFGGHRGLAGKSPWIPFDDLVRVPLLLAGPGIAAGRRSPAIVQSGDLPLTLCELAGVPLPMPASDFDSVSIVPHLGADPPEGRGGRPARFLYNSGWPGARLGGVKLICHWPSWTTLLLDLDADPDERVDRSDDPDYADVRRELEAIVWDGLSSGGLQEPLADWAATRA